MPKSFSLRIHSTAAGVEIGLPTCISRHDWRPFFQCARLDLLQPYAVAAFCSCVKVQFSRPFKDSLYCSLRFKACLTERSLTRGMRQGILNGTGMCCTKGKNGVRAGKVESGVQATPNLLFIQPSRFSWMSRITVVYVSLPGLIMS